MQYADYAVWQRGWLQGDVLEAQLGWWKQQLAGAPPRWSCPPTGRVRPSLSQRGAAVPVRLPRALARAVEALAQREGATPFMVLLAAFQTLLHRYSGQDDVLVGTPIASRRHAETEGLIGFFVNTLVLRAQLRRAADLPGAAGPGARHDAGRLRAPGHALREAGGGAAARRAT